jgi:putative ABC transport system substrate-binding protein
MRRREFIAGLGSAAAWPVTARAQQGDRVRRIGMLMAGDQNDPVYKYRVSAFTQALTDLGWTDGRNVRMEVRWASGDINRIRALAQELVGLQPEIIVTNGTPETAALQRETRTIPVVVAVVSDPIASGIVARLDRPSGNITGFATLEASLGGKWLELLSEIAPPLKRAAFMFNPDTSPASAYLPSLEMAARSLKVVPIIAPVHSDAEIETAIIALGREPGGGLVVISDAFTFAHRGPIISAAARNNVPTFYTDSVFVRDGGLLSYAVDRFDNFRRAATYVDRILRGEKPGSAHSVDRAILVVSPGGPNEISASSISASDSGCCRLPHIVLQWCLVSGDEDNQGHRSDCTGRQHGHSAPCFGGADRSGARTNGVDREPHGWGRDDRCRSRIARRARR